MKVGDNTELSNCESCDKGYVMNAGNDFCVKTEIENCIFGLNTIDQEYCTTCEFFMPSDDMLSCSKPMDISNCMYGTISKEQRIRISALNNLQAISRGKGKVVSI